MTRPRLLDMLQERFHRRLLRVVAGPGFGKTSLLAQARTENLLDPRGIDVWLTCQPGDSVVSTLAEGLMAALQEPVTQHVWDPRAAAEPIAAAIWRRTPEHVALVLDDAHLVPAGSPGARLLEALLERLPSNGHLLLAGRRTPLEGGARLTAMGQVVEVTEDDLGFSAAERSRFAEMRNVPPDLLCDSAGWPALAELTASAGRHRVLDFLWEELLTPMSRERRRLLALVALVGGADDEVAAALAERPVPLSALLAGLPLVAGAPGTWRSLHPLWGPALESELTAQEQAAARVRAAAVMRGRNDIDAAMRQLVLAGAWSEVREVCCETATLTHPLVVPDVLAEWYDLLPSHHRQAAEGQLLLGLLTRSSDLRSALEPLGRAATSFRAGGNIAGELSALTHVAHISWWLDDESRLAAAIERVDELAAQVPALAARAGVGHVWLADLRADWRTAYELLARLPADGVSGPMVAGMEWLKGWMLLLQGEPERACEHGIQSVRMASGTFSATALHLRILSAWQCGDIAEALRDIPLLARATTNTGRALGHVFERSQCALFTAAHGELPAAREHFAKARSAFPGASGAPSAEIAYALAEAAILLREGNEDGARAVLDEELAKRPLHQVGRTRLHRLFPAFSYVLVPATREHWHATAASPALRSAVRVAAALVSAREHGSLAGLPADELPDAGQLRAILPLPWALELAVAAAAAGHQRGPELLEALGPAARTHLRTLAAGHGPLARAARDLLPTLKPVPTSRLGLSVLGHLEVHRDGRKVDHPSLQRDRVRQLLLFLVAHVSAPRQAVAAELWPDLSPDAAARNLRVTLNYTQRLLEPDRADGDTPFFLRADGGVLRLVEDDCLSVDAWRFDRLLDEAGVAERQGAPSLALRAYREALALYRGDYLADLPHAEWAEVERDRLRVRYVTTAVRAGELLLAASDQEAAQALGHAALRVDRWAESAYRLLIAVHVDREELDAGRRVLARCLRMLAELDAEPDPRTQMIARQLRTRGS